MAEQKPRCGDIWAVSDEMIRWIDNAKESRLGKDKERFVLIVTKQEHLDKRHPQFLLVVPMSSGASHTWDYKLERGAHPHSNLTQTTALRLMMIQPVPKEALVRYHGRIGKEVAREIISKINDNLGLEEFSETVEMEHYTFADDFLSQFKKN